MKLPVASIEFSVVVVTLSLRPYSTGGLDMSLSGTPPVVPILEVSELLAAASSLAIAAFLLFVSPSKTAPPSRRRLLCLACLLLSSFCPEVEVTISFMPSPLSLMLSSIVRSAGCELGTRSGFARREAGTDDAIFVRFGRGIVVVEVDILRMIHSRSAVYAEVV